MQIKSWLHNLLLRGILSISLLIGTVSRSYALASFSTGINCMIRGYLYYDGFDISSLNRDDHCNVIEEQTRYNIIVLWSGVHWVIITVPEEEKVGIHSFQYQWGFDTIYYNGKTIPVEWGYIMRG